MTFALPLCPPDQIEHTFELLDTEAENLATPATEAFARQYLQYIRDTYMSGNYGQAPNYEWNFYDRIREGHTTNNPSEGANNRLATRCKTSHPGIYPFIGVIRKETPATYDKMEQFESGNLHRQQTSRAKTTHKSRVKIVVLFEAGIIPLRKMLRSQGVLNTKIKSNRRRGVPEEREAAGEARAGGADGVDLAVRGALVSVTDEHDGADGAEDRGGRVGRGGQGGRGAFSRGRGRARARGVRGRGAAPSHRLCPGCGGSYGSGYLPRHMRAHCPGPAINGQEDDHENEGEHNDNEGEDDPDEEAEESGNGFHVDEILDEVNEVDQTVLGHRRRTGVWRIQEEQEEETALQVQRRLRQQRLQEQRDRPSEDDSPPAQRPRTAPPSAAGPSRPTSFLSAPPPRVNLYPSTSDEEIVITPPPLRETRSPFHITLGEQLTPRTRTEVQEPRARTEVQEARERTEVQETARTRTEVQETARARTEVQKTTWARTEVQETARARTEVQETARTRTEVQEARARTEVQETARATTEVQEAATAGEEGNFE